MKHLYREPRTALPSERQLFVDAKNLQPPGQVPDRQGEKAGVRFEGRPDFKGIKTHYYLQ